MHVKAEIMNFCSLSDFLKNRMITKVKEMIIPKICRTKYGCIFISFQGQSAVDVSLNIHFITIKYNIVNKLLSRVGGAPAVVRQ